MSLFDRILGHLNGGKVLQVGNHDAPFAVIPEGSSTQDLEKFLNQPLRIREKVTHRTADSLIAYINRFKTEDTTVFAHLEAVMFSAVIDYHGAQEQPEWGTHKANYPCPLSREWKDWTERDRKPMSQLQVAEFLEERSDDVVTPNGAALLETCRNFKVVRKATFGAAQTLSTGEFSFQYSQENQKGSIEWPENITLALAPFHSGEKYEVKARFRYRLNEGELRMWYELIDPEAVLEDAFNTVRDRIKEETGCWLVEGSQ